jgi:hypothetical protein
VVAEDLTTAMMDLDAGPVEYGLDQRGPDCVLLCHGGHMRAGLALGEELLPSLATASWCHRAPATAAPRCEPAGHRPGLRMRLPSCADGLALGGLRRWSASRPAGRPRSPWPPGIHAWCSGCCCWARSGSAPIRTAARAAACVLVSFSSSCPPRTMRLRTISSSPASRSTFDHRSAHSSPRRAPVVAASHSRTAKSGSAV